MNARPTIKAKIQGMYREGWILGRVRSGKGWLLVFRAWRVPQGCQDTYHLNLGSFSKDSIPLISAQLGIEIVEDSKGRRYGGSIARPALANPDSLMGPFKPWSVKGESR